MKWLFTILLFVSAQSFGQAVDVKLESDSATKKISISLGGLFIKDIPTKPESSIDTIYALRIERYQENSNSSFLMTKVKYIIRKKVNGEFVYFGDDGKQYNVKSYQHPVYKTWISL